MSHEIASIDSVSFDGASTAKQELLEQYARGEISLAEVAGRVSEIQPVEPHRSWRAKTAMICMAVVAALFLPAGIQRD